MFMRKTIFFIICLLNFSFALKAQHTKFYTDDNHKFREAKKLYLTETYVAAQDKFESLSNQNVYNKNREAVEYYAALTDLIADNKNAEKQFLAFQNKYPHSIYAQTGSWELGSYYLKKGDIETAYKYLTQNDINDLPERKRNEYQFKLGYANVMLGNEDEALNLLEPLTNSELYQDESNYYVGHIYYAQGDFEKAFKHFDQLKFNNPSYDRKVLPYLVQIAFNQAEYDKAINDGKRLLAGNINAFTRSEISKIIGESYFKKQMYDEAIPYLEAYKGELSNADYYQLGYAYYQKAEFGKAVNLFNKIVGERNAMAQTAYYQLGNAYLQSGKKQEALTAFKSASEMEFDKGIQEDAFYNYAKLSYDIGNPFTGTPELMQSFISKFSNSKYKKEINGYLIDAYINSGNYASALDALNKISKPNNEQLTAKQRVAFMLGIELFKENKFKEATENLEFASKSNYNKEIKAKSLFWLGESYYRMGNYHKAVDSFEGFRKLGIGVEESKEVNYQLGYSYLKLKAYNNAIMVFEDYIASDPSGDFKSDAKLRLADSFIGAKETSKALKLYQELAQQSAKNADEAAYNKAIVLGIQGKTQEKIKALEDFMKKYPVSKYFENASFELAEAYMKVGNYSSAEKTLNEIIKNASPNMVARARLRKGLMLYNQNKNQQAVSEFKAVAKDYPRTALALEAIESAKRIYVEEGNLNGFETWANSLGYYQVDSAELEQLAFERSIKFFEEKKYYEAITSFKNFLGKYENSSYDIQANYFLAESYYLTNQKNEAVKPFSVVAANSGKRQEDALLRLSQIYLTENKTTEALLALEELIKTTNNPEYLSFAEVHLMRIYSKKSLHDIAVKMANKVLDNTKNEQAVLQEAELIKARNLYFGNNKEQAKMAFAKLENASNNAIKAEARYYKAKFLNEDKEYSKSNDVIFELASKFSNQQYWGSKALIIMADNYFYLNDKYQATETINVVLENYQNFPDVIAEAKEIQNKINTK